MRYGIVYPYQFKLSKEIKNAHSFFRDVNISSTNINLLKWKKYDNIPIYYIMSIFDDKM